MRQLHVSRLVEIELHTVFVIAGSTNEVDIADFETGGVVCQQARQRSRANRGAGAAVGRDDDRLCRGALIVSSKDDHAVETLSTFEQNAVTCLKAGEVDFVD